MKVSTHCVVSLSWTLDDAQGERLDHSDEPTEFLLGSHDLLPRIESSLLGRQAGDTLDLHLEPEDAFGDFDEQLIFLEPRARLPEELEEGMVFEGLPPGCSPDAPADRLYFVSEIYPDHVVMDGNHPLAGLALRLHLTLHAVREASAEERATGTLGQGFLQLRA